MMCDSCKHLAERSLARQENPSGSPRHISHLRKKKPHCEYPETCTCQHEPIAKGYVNGDKAQQ